MGVDRDLLEIKQRLALIETRLQQVFEHLDIAPRESAGGAGEGNDAASDPEIQDLLAKGNESQALKRYRELTGASLSEAKAALDRARSG